MVKKLMLLFFSILLSQVVCAVPSLDYVAPTNNNGASITETNVEVNVSIVESNLDKLIYNWNGTNYTYYNDSLIMMFNFNNVPSLGENDYYVFDVSGNNNNGTAVNGATYTTSGKYSGGFDFDGSEDRVTVPTTFGISTAHFSISTWVNLDSTSENGAFVKIGGVSPNYGFAIGVGGESYDNAGNDLVLLYEGIRWIDTNQPIGTGWHHVAMTVDSNGYPKGFIDGAQVYSDTTGTGSGPQQDITYVGGYTGSEEENRHADVTLDEVRIWNRTLDSNEVYQQYISNLEKFNQTQWHLYINQEKNATDSLDLGTYTYEVFGTDNLANTVTAGLRTIIIQAAVPEFSDYAIMLILITTVGGFYFIRKQN